MHPQFSSSDDQPLLALKSVSLGYGGVALLNDVNLTIARGETIGIWGRNGSGKSSLLRAIAGILPFEGHLLINGKSLPTGYSVRTIRNHGLGFLPQYARNVIDLTVEENLLLSLWDISSRSERAKRIQEILKTPPFDQLSDHRNSPAALLSGGQDLLLGLATLLLRGYDIMLLDEPSDGLDEANKKMVIDLVKGLNNERKTVIIVEQMMRVLFAVASRVYVVKEEVATTPTKAETVANTLAELPAESQDRIKGLFTQHAVLSADTVDLIDTLIWQ